MNLIFCLFPTAEGFYDYEKLKYIYQYKDHLGNVRLSYSKNPVTGAIKQEDKNDYYPFGLNFISNVFGGGSLFNPVTSFKNWKYNNKELQETGMYDYGARMYMPDIGRWGVVDPLAETSRRWSPYTYAYNNPMRFVDPDGMQNEDIIFRGKQSAINKTQETLNAGLGGKDYVQIDSNGRTSLDMSDKQIANLTSEQKGLYDVLQKGIDAECNIEIGVVESDGQIVAGSYSSQMIDIDDINNFGSGELMNKYTVVGHELDEQYNKQYLGKDGNDSHTAAMKTESKINGGWERNPKPEFSNRSTKEVSERVGNSTRTYQSPTYDSKINFSKNGVNKSFEYKVVNGNVIKNP